jgi:serine/threonine protein kinase
MFHTAGVSGRGKGLTAGTPGWMAPELCDAFGQLKSAPHNKASDVYAFGLVRLNSVQSLLAINLRIAQLMYYLFTGKTPSPLPPITIIDRPDFSPAKCDTAPREEVKSFKQIM